MLDFEQLKRRKIVQWALAYLAGAWLVIEALDLLGEAWGVPPALVRIAHVGLAFGFFVSLVLAWYHGEQGRQRLSGPELLMVAALLLIAGVALTVVGDRSDVGDPDPAGPPTAGAGVLGDSIPTRSIAVLPLDNFSPDGENEYFAAAMTEEITNALMKVPELRVAARNSAAKFVDSDLTVGEFVTQELGYAHALEGSVRLQGGRARIIVQLIDGRTDEHVWSDEYEVELIDVLDVQVDIARQVADRLASTFSDREAERIRAGSTDDPRAYDLYLQATGLIPPESIEDVDRTLLLLGEAVRRDTTFALAYGDLAGALLREAHDDPRFDPHGFSSFRARTSNRYGGAVFVEGKPSRLPGHLFRGEHRRGYRSASQRGARGSEQLAHGEFPGGAVRGRWQLH